MKNIFILITVCTVGYTQCLGDMNRDGIKDVLDIVDKRHINYFIFAKGPQI